MDQFVFLICLVTCGLIFSFAGVLMWYAPPKTMNHFYGYRTPSAMKSSKHWNFAQTYAAKELIWHGVILALIGSLDVVVSLDEMPMLFAAMFIVILDVVILIFRVELAIKRKFKS